MFKRGGVNVQGPAALLDNGPYRGAPDEETGMVFCPMKRSGIAVMKCAEYQGTVPLLPRSAGTVPVCPCPNAVTKKQIDEMRASMQISESDKRRDTCAHCGEAKKATISPLCYRCANAGPRKRRRVYAICERCKEAKSLTTRRLCYSCAQTLRQRALKREQERALIG